MASFSYVFGVSVSRSFFDRLGVGFGVDLEPFGLPNGVYVEGFGGSVLGLFFYCFPRGVGWLTQAPRT